jgi:hypothetical protein
VLFRSGQFLFFYIFIGRDVLQLLIGNAIAAPTKLHDLPLARPLVGYRSRVSAHFATKRHC